jgi:CopG family nickel-responsive transcriptional regulator
MVIVSLSLNETILEEIDKIQREMGYSGRSEVIRAGARLLISENKENEKLSGVINAILLLIHRQEKEDIVSEIKHDFEDVTNSQIHSHLRDNKCLEIFILSGESKRIIDMVRLYKTSGKMDYVKLVIA